MGRLSRKGRVFETKNLKQGGRVMCLIKKAAANLILQLMGLVQDYKQTDWNSGYKMAPILFLNRFLHQLCFLNKFYRSTLAKNKQEGEERHYTSNENTVRCLISTPSTRLRGCWYLWKLNNNIFQIMNNVQPLMYLYRLFWPNGLMVWIQITNKNKILLLIIKDHF
jgi:hypothetical protein